MASQLVVVLGAGVNRKNGTGGHASGAAGRGRRVPRRAVSTAHRSMRAASLGISEYVALTKGIGPLYDELRRAFRPRLRTRRGTSPARRGDHVSAQARRATPRPAHRHNELPMSRWSAPSRRSGEPFDVVSWISLSAVTRGERCRRRRPRFNKHFVVEVPNAYPGLSLEDNRPSSSRLPDR